jgi:hypothetical protein
MHPEPGNSGNHFMLLAQVVVGLDEYLQRLVGQEDKKGNDENVLELHETGLVGKYSKEWLREAGGSGKEEVGSER